MTSILTLKRLLFLYTFLTFHSIIAQPWTQTKGPAGGFVTDLIERNGTILAGSLGGIYRTTDDGENWTHAMNGIPANANLTYFAQTTNYIYAGGYSEGLYRSSNGGLNWTAVSINLPSIFILELFAIGDTLYIGCEGAGVIRSVNGAPFEFVNTGFGASAYAVAFAQVGDYIFCGLAGNGGSVGVYRSPIGNISWTQINTGLIQFPSVLDLAVDGNDLYVLAQSAFDAGLFKSTDLGNSWFEPLVDFDDFGGSILAYQGALYTTPDAGFPRKSVDGGVTWTQSGNGLKPLSALSYLGTPSGIFIGSERGIMRSTDQGQNWQVKSKGFTNVSATSLYADGNRLYATAHTSNVGRSDGVFYTDDNGENWMPLDKGLQPNPEVFALVRSGSNIIIGTGSTGLYLKPDNSDSFTQVTDILTYNQINVLLSVGQYVLAGASGLGEIYRSSDYGVTWAQSNSGFFTDQEDQVFSLYNYNGTIFAGAFNALYKSTDNGLTWTNSSSGIYPGDTVYAITALGTTLFSATDTNGIYKSTNNGATWVNTNAAIGQVKALTTLNGVLYAGSAGGIHISSDNGATWVQDNSGLQSSIVFGLAVSQGHLFAATEHRSVWTKSGSLPTDKFDTSANDISISPNPSNGLVDIHFGSYSGIAEITLFNTIGQQVFKESLTIYESCSVDFGLQPSGIYIANIKIGALSIRKKLV